MPGKSSKAGEEWLVYFTVRLNWGMGRAESDVVVCGRAKLAEQEGTDEVCNERIVVA